MFSLLFRNDTRRAWTACVYQELSHARRFETLAWLTAATPPGTESKLLWTETMSIVLGELAAASRHSLYVPLDRVETVSGTRWRIVSADGRQRLQHAGRAPLRDQILVANDSGRPASPGVAVSGAPVCFAPHVPGGATAQFLTRATHYVALFTDIRAGEVMRRPVIQPLPLKFAPGSTAGTLHVYEEGPKLVVDLRPGGILFVPLDQLEE